MPKDTSQAFIRVASVFPAAPISQAVRSGNFVFVAGITPFDLDLRLIKDDFEAQMRQTMKNLRAILKASASCQTALRGRVAAKNGTATYIRW